jgi:c-di-GMP-binding flagellar brake protein YcgR
MLALDHLKDFRIVQITLPIREEQTLTLECVARRRSVNTIEAAFLPGQLPLKDLDINGSCRLFFVEENRPFRLRSTIEEVIDGEKLRLKAVEMVMHFGDREFFRVDTDLTFKYRRLVEGEDAKTRQLSARVNISGCGIRLPLPDAVRMNEKIALTLILSQDPLKVARCVAQVKRLCSFAGGQKGAALHFIEIEPVDRDAIISFCMATQREELRNKVQTRDLG